MKVMAVAFLLLPSCVAKAQFDLSSLSNLGDVVTNLTSVFNPDQQASTKSIVGTWEYSEPAILFTSDNFLAQAGAKIASNKIEQNIQKHLNKYGIKKGALKFTFRADGTYTEVLGKKTPFLCSMMAVSNTACNSLKIFGINTVRVNSTVGA